MKTEFAHQYSIYMACSGGKNNQANNPALEKSLVINARF